MKKMTTDEFFQKKEWEGGYRDMYNYGVLPRDLKDDDFALLWEDYCALCVKMEELENQLDAYDKEAI